MVISLYPFPRFPKVLSSILALSLLVGSTLPGGTLAADNEPPVAEDDTAFVTANSGGNPIDVLANDTTELGEDLTIISVTQPADGTVIFTATQVTFAPNPGFTGTTTFTYIVSDGNGGSDTATVTVTVSLPNTAPDAADDSIAVGEDSGATALGVLANDWDADQDSLSIDAVTQPSNGTVTFTAGDVSFTPNADFNGITTFTYTVSDGNGGTDTATVTMTVTGVNDAPQASDDAATAAEDSGATTIDVLANDTDIDGDALSITGVTQPAHGTVTFTAGDVSFAPAGDFAGTTSFTYTASDSNGGSDTATVNVTVTAANDAPDAADDTAEAIADGETVAIDVLANDQDVDGDALAVIGVTQPAQGTVTFTVGGVSYAPPSDFGGTATFAYTVSDGNGGTDTAAVAVEVTLLTYTIDVLPNVTLTALTGGYASGSQQTRTVTIARTGTGPLANLTVALSGAQSNAFVATQPAATALNDATTSTTFTLKAKDGLQPGAYSATVTVSADRMTPVSFTVTQTVNAPPAIVTTPPPAASTGVEVLVNGRPETMGQAETTTMENGRTRTTVAVDPAKLQARLDAVGERPIITVPTSGNADSFVGELDARSVRSLSQKQAVVVFRTEAASYVLPAERIFNENLLARHGVDPNAQDTVVQIEIARPQDAMLQVVENAAAAGELSIVAPPLDFAVRVASGGETVELTTFEAYVERTVAIPEGVDPSKITTAIVVDPDGRTRHVPTRVTTVDGKHYAVINSLTNSTYTVVWNPVEYADVEGHWAQEAANDMSSRMVVIAGAGETAFRPNAAVTRGEFAGMLVRALGLRPVGGDSPFADVRPNDEDAGFIHAAHAYGLLVGHEDGRFRPHDPITREQAMTAIAKAADVTGLAAGLPAAEAAPLLTPYADAADVSTWAKAGVVLGLQSGLLQGRTATLLEPKADLTRAEAAALLQRLLQKSGLI